MGIRRKVKRRLREVKLRKGALGLNRRYSKERENEKVKNREVEHGGL